MGLGDLFGLDHFWEDFFGGYKDCKQRAKAEQELRGCLHKQRFAFAVAPSHTRII